MSFRDQIMSLSDEVIAKAMRPQPTKDQVYRQHKPETSVTLTEAIKSLNRSASYR